MVMQTHSPSDETGAAEEEHESQLAQIAEQLADLSATAVVPEGQDPTAEFQADDVDFNSNDWLGRVIEIQAWLNLNEDVQLLDDGESTARQLFVALGLVDPEQAYSVGGSVSLTEAGEEALTSRLDRAIAHRNQFIEDCEALNLSDASARWQEAWDEELELNDPVEPLDAEVAAWKIKDFSDFAADNLLILNPSYQRADVWPTTDAQMLIESIIKGIPLPSIIILRSDESHAYEIVDGKQRLTSILRFMGRHPEATRRVRAMDEQFDLGGALELAFHNDYKRFRRLWRQHTGEKLTGTVEKSYYFPFKLRKSTSLPSALSHLGGKYYCDIKDQEIALGERRQTIKATFERQNNYNMPVIIYSRATPRQIHEVFNLYNKQGKHLNAEEIRNALYHEVDLVRLLLVAAGDNPDIESLAPYLPADQHAKLEEMAEWLEHYNFGVARYKRTKLLSWLCAMLLQPALSADVEQSGIRSTAAQIDKLFRTIQSDSRHALSHQPALCGLINDLHTCLQVHSSADCWAPSFRDNQQGQKWQELQLIASLVGTFLICAGVDSAEDLLESRSEAVEKFTRENPRPRKTQNKEQWSFIGRVTIGLLEALEVDQERLEQQLLQRYQYSCLPMLRAAAALS